jgi:CHAT domain-containing protein
MHRLLILLAALSSAGPAWAELDLDIEAGRQLVAELALDQAIDQVLFQRVGFDHASVLLTAVMTRGQAITATPREWREMHRAIGGLVELSVAQGEFFRAAIFADFQNIYYRNNEGDYGAALDAARQQLELQQKSGQTATLYIAWKNIGENLIRLGRIDEGLDSLYQAHRLIDSPTTLLSAIIWRQIVDGEIAGKHPEAARRESDAFLRQADPSSPALFRAHALLAQAHLDVAEGRYNEGLNNIRAAGQSMAGDKDANGFGYESANELLSMVLFAMNSIPYTEAMALARRIDREFPDLPISISPAARRAMDYRRRLAGEFDTLLREDTARLEQARSQNDIAAQIELIRSLASTYQFANDARQTVTLLEDALLLEKSMLPAGGLPADAASQDSYFRLMANLGYAYANIKDPQKARIFFAEMTRDIDALPAAAARARLVRLYGEAELGKALVEELEHHPDVARAILQKALHAPATGPARFTPSAVSLQAARLERNLNEQPLEAVRYYEEAIQALRAEKDVRTEIATRLQLARYLAVEGADRISEAQVRAAEQLKFVEVAATAIQFADAQWRVRLLQGIVAENTGRANEAIDLYTQAVTKLDQMRAGLSQQEQRQAFMDNDSIQDLYRRLIALLTSIGQKQQAWDYLERGKARSFLEMLQGRRFRAGTITAGAQELHTIEREIIDLRAQLGEQSAGSGGADNAHDITRVELRNAEGRFAFARQRSALQGSRAGQELSLRPLHVEEVQAKLPSGTALIEYALLDNKIMAFVITRQHVVQALWEVDSVSLRSQVEGARELLGHPDENEALQPLLENLSSVLIQPVLAQVPSDIHALLLIPAGFLNYLPFQVLPLGDGHDVIDRFTVAYLPSASALEFLRPLNNLKGKLFLGAIGNVSVDGSLPLPGTLREVQGIAQTYRSPRMAVEERFTYGRLRRALLEDESVHLATHAILNKDSPLFNALITSPIPGQPSRLSLYELTQMKLKARLVVLSACETGLGELRTGDEITGLTRMFLQAGAETVVASLWNVSDRATAKLMKDFYQRLHAGQSPAGSLRSAALGVRKLYPHPYYWAPFVLTGAR